MKRILSLGQCAADHAGLRWFLRAQFDDVEIDPAATEIEAIAALTSRSYDLVLVNRILDRDHSSGVAILRRLKADDRFRALPLMLVSNHADAQEQAVAAGAVPGFGKANLDDDAAAKIRACLAAEPTGESKSDRG